MPGFQRMFMMSVLAIVGLQMVQVAAQVMIIVPNCTSATGFDWTSNSKGQNPCTLAATLQSFCFGDRWQIDPIASPQSQYSGPLKGQSNNCQCSTVTFSLAAACGACQGGADASWSEWSHNCTESDTTIAGYPQQIPVTTPIPAWAYLNVTAMGDLWNATAALSTSNSNLSEITGGPPTASTAPTAPTRKSKAGPIAGGVVGGVVGLVALALAGFILYRRLHRPRHDTTQHVDEKVDISGAGHVDPRQANEYHSQVWTPITHTDVPTLYNPADPTTFPPSPFTISNSGHSHQHMSHGQAQAPAQTPMYVQGGHVGPQGSRPDVTRAVGYQGAPEV